MQLLIMYESYESSISMRLAAMKKSSNVPSSYSDAPTEMRARQIAS